MNLHEAGTNFFLSIRGFVKIFIRVCLWSLTLSMCLATLLYYGSLYMILSLFLLVSPYESNSKSWRLCSQWGNSWCHSSFGTIVFHPDTRQLLYHIWSTSHIKHKTNFNMDEGFQVTAVLTKSLTDIEWERDTRDIKRDEWFQKLML